jgi:hypothetical protein
VRLWGKEKGREGSIISNSKFLPNFLLEGWQDERMDNGWMDNRCIKKLRNENENEMKCCVASLPVPCFASGFTLAPPQN